VQTPYIADKRAETWLTLLSAGTGRGGHDLAGVYVG
jgi:hypothetical protein